MRHPWANLALLGLVLIQVGTGLASLLAPPAGVRVAIWVHAVGAYAILVVLFSKATVVWDAVRRRPGLGATRAALAAMVLLLAAVLATGLAWIAAGRYALLGISGINLHAYLALVLAALVGWHALDRRWVARAPRAADRAALLRMAAVAVAGAAVWQVERTAQALLGTPGSRRRYTGSYEAGSFGGRFPVTSWLNDDAPAIDGERWRLVVEGAVDRPVALSLADLRRLGPESLDATLDCTGGWYTRQTWTGVRLARLLAVAGLGEGAGSVEVHSATGFRRRFDLDEAAGLLLATAVAGRPLSRGHGAPARLVVPGRRGFAWVKWVTRIEVLRSSHLLQPPLPLT